MKSRYIDDVVKGNRRVRYKGPRKEVKTGVRYEVTLDVPGSMLSDRFRWISEIGRFRRREKPRWEKNSGREVR